MFILKKGQQPGVYVPLRALFLVVNIILWYKIYVQVYYKEKYIIVKLN